jgi:hypothetical protein
LAFVSFLAHVPLVMLHLGDVVGAKSLLAQHPDCLTCMSTVLHWVLAQALIDCLDPDVDVFAHGTLATFDELRNDGAQLDHLIFQGYSSVIALSMGHWYAPHPHPSTLTPP